jgi:uncharacterized protein YcgL (UPF0745 family)
MKCLVYRCSRKQEMYLYVPWRDDTDDPLAHLPEGLAQLTGRLDPVMELDLEPGRSLARADPEEVRTALRERGFYLQLPPDELLHRDDSMLADSSDGF